MTKIYTLATLFLLSQFVFADSQPTHEEPLEGSISYAYSPPCDDIDSFSYKELDKASRDHDLKDKPLKDSQPPLPKGQFRQNKNIHITCTFDCS